MEHAHYEVSVLSTGFKSPGFFRLEGFLISELLKPRRGQEISSSKVRLTSLSAFPCIMGRNIIPVIHLTNSLTLQRHGTQMQVCHVCHPHFPFPFANSWSVVAVIYVVWWAGTSAGGCRNVWITAGPCALPGCRVFSVICGTEDWRCGGVLGGMCCCLCCSCNPELACLFLVSGVIAPSLDSQYCKIRRIPAVSGFATLGERAQLLTKLSGFILSPCLYKLS